MPENDKVISSLEKKLDKSLEAIRLEVDDLYETVYKGNGKPSLVTRVNEVEGKIKGLREQMNEKFAHQSAEHSLKFDTLHQKLENKFGRLEGWIETKFNSMEEIMKTVRGNQTVQQAGSWQFKAAIVTAGAAIIGAVITYVVNS